MRPTEREVKAWRRWLLGRHEKCPVCGRPMPSGKRSLDNSGQKPHKRTGRALWRAANAIVNREIFPELRRQEAYDYRF
ncbi:hypothetical protein HYR54_07710 [Candidatus Acetothermia bacterium]|nr:hypothetical protein [Candidatus Acetothermia bacterium]